MRRFNLMLALLPALAFVACGAPTSTPTPTPTPVSEKPSSSGPLATIAIRSSAATVAVEGRIQFEAVGQDSAGNLVAVSPLWSAAPQAGDIDGAGSFKAGAAAGTFSDAVTVTSGGISASVTLTVTAGPLAVIAVTPDLVTLAVNSTQPFTAAGKDAYGNAVPVSPTWSVVAAGGTISADGSFTAGNQVAAFNNTVRASQGGVSGYATVLVSAGPVALVTLTPATSTLVAQASQQFTATGRDADGNLVPISAVWSAASGGVITSTGLFTAGAVAGSFPNAVTVTSGATSASASVTVIAGALKRLTLTPTTAMFPVGGSQQFFAMGRDALGNVVAVSPVWSVVAGGGSISPSGLFTAGRSAGTFLDTVKVTAGGLADWVSVTVTADALATITVTPATVAMAADTTQLFTAFGLDVNGNGVSISPVWSAGPGGGINSAGLYTSGPTAGSFHDSVSASFGGIVGHASVAVTAGPLTTINITSPAAAMAMSSVLQFTATGTDANGNVVSLTPAWSVVAGGGAVDPFGQFTSGTVAGTFTNTVRATSGSISANATVTVTPGALATLSVTPASTSLAIGATQLFTATGKDAFNNAVVLTPVWSVLAGGGVINAAGLFIAGTVAGTFPATIRAASGAVSGTASVTVNPGLLATITVTGNTPGLLVSTTRQLVATGADASGNAVPLTATWSVVAGGGTVNAAGLFTAGGVAGTFTNTVLAASGGTSGYATMTLTAAPLPSNAIALGAASTFAILAGTAVTNGGATALTGDVGLDPGGLTSVTGFPPGTYTGLLHVNDALATQAQTDLTSAYLAAQGAVCPTGHDKSGIDLGALPFVAGVWCFSTTAGLTGTLTLDGGGDSNAVFIFQVGSALSTATSSLYVLQNGAQAKNVFWQVGSSATLGVNSALPGTVLALTDITLTNGAALLGRGLARNGTVTLATNAVTVP
jgi:hypothetical protein